MRNDIHSALLSVAEVAVFAFSLLELLLTRLLPLAGFLAGHLLLQFLRLLASIVAAASGCRKRRGESSHLPAEEELLQEASSVQHNDDWKGLEDHQLYEETLNDDHKFKHRQRIVSNDEADVLQGATQVVDVAAVRSDHPHVADSAPYSDAQVIVSCPSDFLAIGVQGATPDAEAADELLHVTNLTPCDADVPEGLSNTGLDRQTSEEAGEKLVLTVKAEMLRDASQSRSSSRRRRAAPMQMRVLPPSLSQVKRSIMQRSRRSSPASPNKAIKKQSPRNRKLASALRSSTSNDNFMRKFREHFLLD